MQKKIFFCSLVFALSSLPVSAQELRRITQDEAVELAIKNNLTLESQRITTAGLKRNSDLFWNQFIPNLNLTGGASMANEKTETISTPGGNVPTDMSQWTVLGNLQVQLQLPLAALGHGIKKLKLDYKNGVVNYDKAKLQLERDIRKSYNEVLLLQEQLNLQQQSFDNAKAQAESSRINYLNGRSPELSWMQADVTAKNMQPAVDQLRNGVKMAKNQLAMNLGLNFDEIELDLEPLDEGNHFVSLNTEELVKQALERKPEILDLKAQLQTIQAARTAQLLSYWTPALSATWNMQGTYTPMTKPTDAEWQKSGSLQLMLAWTPTNFLPFSINYQSVKSVDDNLSKLSIGLTQTIQATELEVYNKLFTLEQTRQSMEATQANVDLARRSYNMTRQAYGGGLQNFLQVQQSEEQLNKAQLSMQQQKFDYINNLLDLEYAIGVPFGTYSSLK